MRRRTPLGRRLTVRGRLSRTAAEALRLEIRRIAVRLGLPPDAVQVRRVGDRPR